VNRLVSKKFIYALVVTIVALVHGDTQVALAIAPLYLGAQAIIDHKGVGGDA